MCPFPHAFFTITTIHIITDISKPDLRLLVSIEYNLTKGRYIAQPDVGLTILVKLQCLLKIPRYQILKYQTLRF